MSDEAFKDMLIELNSWLITDPKIIELFNQGCVKSFNRPDYIDETQTSIVYIPVGTPQQSSNGSNQSLNKQFIYQINVESIDRLETKTLQRTIELILQEHGFKQIIGGLDEYFQETKRYVDARRYKIFSPLYENY